MAAGHTLTTVLAQMAEFPLNAGAALVNIRSNGHAVLEFHPDVERVAFFSAWMPRYYSGGSLGAIYTWTAKTATSGSVVWFIALERQNEALDFDNDGANYPQAATVVSAAPANAGGPVYAALAPGPVGIQPGERFRIVVIRVGPNAQDTMLGDAELHSIEIYEY